VSARVRGHRATVAGLAVDPARRQHVEVLHDGGRRAVEIDVEEHELGKHDEYAVVLGVELCASHCKSPGHALQGVDQNGRHRRRGLEYFRRQPGEGVGKQLVRALDGTIEQAHHEQRQMALVAAFRGIGQAHQRPSQLDKCGPRGSDLAAHRRMADPPSDGCAAGFFEATVATFG